MLDFRLTEQIIANDGHQIATWMERSHTPHDLAMVTGPNGALHHFAFWVDDWNAVREAADLLAFNGVTIDVAPTRHGVTRGYTVYFFDPVGNRNEMFTGGYWVDPDFEPITWTEEEMGRAMFYYAREVNERFFTVHSLTAGRPSRRQQRRRRSGAPTGPTRRSTSPATPSASRARQHGPGEPADERHRGPALPAPVPRPRRTRRRPGAGRCRWSARASGSPGVRRHHPQPRDHPRGAHASGTRYTTEIRIIRHGITQGYSTDAGLTPMGAWQAHQRGQALARTLREWPQMRIVCARHQPGPADRRADPPRPARRAGQYGRDCTVTGPEPVEELKNFQVWTPDGVRDITASFRKYQAEMEKMERMAVGDRPRWLVEIDRFYRTQLGGADPIQQWLTIPLMYFESPQACVRRFWKGFNRLIAESPGQRIIAATHSGPIRAFATWAHGYDPGEPVNTEEVVVRIKQGGRTATVSYRNRVTEVNVPQDDEIPRWDA